MGEGGERREEIGIEEETGHTSVLTSSMSG